MSRYISRWIRYSGSFLFGTPLMFLFALYVRNYRLISVIALTKLSQDSQGARHQEFIL